MTLVFDSPGGGTIYRASLKNEKGTGEQTYYVSVYRQPGRGAMLWSSPVPELATGPP